MQITGAGSGTLTAAGATKTATNGTLGKDDFLKLLVTQMQNQDPLNPTDNSQFVSQLAQFSSLEGVTNLNTSMEGLTKSLSSIQNYSTAGLIGKNVKADGNGFAYSNSPVTFGYSLTGDASSVNVNINDASGRLVRRLDMGSQPSGSHETGWDGKDNGGIALPAGSYTFSITAKDARNSSIDAPTYITGKISSVSFDANGANLVVGGSKISQNKIKEIY